MEIEIFTTEFFGDKAFSNALVVTRHMKQVDQTAIKILVIVIVSLLNLQPVALPI